MSEVQKVEENELRLRLEGAEPDVAAEAIASFLSKNAALRDRVGQRIEQMANEQPR